MRKLHCFPSIDVDFCAAGADAFATIDSGVRSDLVEDLLADALRPDYADVRVVRQAPVARVTDDEVWYAFRDGQLAHEPPTR